MLLGASVGIEEVIEPALRPEGLHCFGWTVLSCDDVIFELYTGHVVVHIQVQLRKPQARHLLRFASTIPIWTLSAKNTILGQPHLSTFLGKRWRGCLA